MLVTIAHPNIMFMNAIDLFYSSVSDCRWFLGNPNIHETKGFTWFINSSKPKEYVADWQISFSEPAAGFSYTERSIPLISNEEKRKAIFLITPAYHPF